MITEMLLSEREIKWIDIQDPEQGDFERLTQHFDLPHLLIQDTLRPEHLPKFEETENGSFLMIRAFNTHSSQEDTTVQGLTRKLAIFTTDHTVVTIHRTETEFLHQIAEKVRRTQQPKNLHSLVHSIILTAIRTYEAPISRLQDLYDEFEQEILERNAEHLSTTRIYHFRRQIFILKRILKQTNDALYAYKDFWENHPSMLQDLRENVDQLYFRLDEVSDTFDHLFELHIALNDQRANEVMKVLTVFSTILLPLNFMASFYGMNFDYLPGLHSKYGLSILIFSMIFASLLGIWYFKKRGWFKGYWN